MIKIEQPDWILVKDLCRNKIIQRFPKYGNSWVGNMDESFWNARLYEEFREAEMIPYNMKTLKIYELVDIINICAMQITNLSRKQ